MTEVDQRVHQVVLMPSGLRGSVAHGTNLLDAARGLGVELESICGGRQTCGKCQVIVEAGQFPKHGISSAVDHLTPVESTEADYADKHGLGGRRLACAACVLGDLLIVVPEESQARKQIIAKAATERVIVVDPAVRKIYVEVPAATLESQGGDWERLQAAIAEQWELASMTIDPSVLPRLQSALHAGANTVTLTLWQDRQVIRIEPGYVEGVYGLAVDVGSTTVVAHLCDLRTGAVLATEAMMNPQVRYGEDLMSRVSYGMMNPQGVERMHRAVVRGVNELAEKAAAVAGLTMTDIMDVVVVGNTIMHHLFLGIDPVELGGAPFALAVAAPLDLKAREVGLNLNPAAMVHVLPCIAGHVGADHVAVLLAEAPQDSEETVLVIDVGTNAEISVGDRRGLVCASSPTGPAFEGAQIAHGQRAAPGAIERVRIDPDTLEPRYKVIGHPEWVEPGATEPVPASARPTGICGSGIIEAIAEMFLSGIVGADGRIDPSLVERSPRLRFSGRVGEYCLVDAKDSATGQPIVVTQNDVRAIQLAKAALYTGAKLLMAEKGVDRVDRIILCGAFGTFIDPRHAMVLGLIPDCDLRRVFAAGNAAGDGARIALLSRAQRLEAARLAKWVQHVQIAISPEFQEEFVAALGLPHAGDAFPHLAGMIPEPKAAASELRRSKRRSTPIRQERDE
ncbi:MAG TPA: ASKHA domain-containing protein [Anaerolineales bacterium]|nr:ASKHA domain-containing protein [Anaerolineales bacterium]